MRKHTEGPWVVNFDEYDGKVSVRSGNARDLADCPIYYELVSSVGGRVHGASFDDYSEVEANANLIAAAPDLLEALENLTNLYYGKDQQIQAGEYARQALAAIAKATGGKV